MKWVALLSISDFDSYARLFYANYFLHCSRAAHDVVQQWAGGGCEFDSLWVHSARFIHAVEWPSEQVTIQNEIVSSANGCVRILHKLLGSDTERVMFEALIDYQCRGGVINGEISAPQRATRMATIRLQQHPSSGPHPVLNHTRSTVRVYSDMLCTDGRLREYAVFVLLERVRTESIGGQKSLGALCQAGYKFVVSEVHKFGTAPGNETTVCTNAQVYALGAEGYRFLVRQWISWGEKDGPMAATADVVMVLIGPTGHPVDCNTLAPDLRLVW